MSLGINRDDGCSACGASKEGTDAGAEAVEILYKFTLIMRMTRAFQDFLINLIGDSTLNHTSA